MKKHKVIVTVVLLVSIIVGSSLVFDSMKKNSFPYKYQDILTSYLGDYTIEKKAKNKADKTERSMSDSWYMNYGKQLKDNMLIYDEKSFFTQLQDTYVSHHFLQLSEKINAKDSILYLRNAFMAIPSIILNHFVLMKVIILIICLPRKNHHCFSFLYVITRKQQIDLFRK